MSSQADTGSTIAYDTLVRGGVTCTSAYVGEVSNNMAVCSRGIKIIADTSLASLTAEEIAAFDALVVPGGAKGAETLSKNQMVQTYVAEFFVQKKLVGMICAGDYPPPTDQLI